MLTEDQIKKLKPGDPVIIRGTFEGITDYGDICVKSPMTFCGSMCADHIKYSHPSVVSLVEPRYDPYRLFKKGDRVKTRSVFGRKIYINDTLYEVMWDESYNKISVKDLTSAETLVGMPSVFFELVTPVEELEPYYIEEKDIEFQVRMKYEDKDCLISVFRFKNIVEGYKQYYDMLPSMKQAGEAAAAECERLNKDYNNKQK